MLRFWLHQGRADKASNNSKSAATGQQPHLLLQLASANCPNQTTSSKPGVCTHPPAPPTQPSPAAAAGPRRPCAACPCFCPCESSSQPPAGSRQMDRAGRRQAVSREPPSQSNIASLLAWLQ